MKENNNIKLKWLVILFLTLFAAFLLSIFRINDDDRIWFILKVPDEANKIITVDIAKLNPIKYYLQPGTISLYGRIKNSKGLTDLNAEFIGTEAFISQGSKKSQWTPLRPTDCLNQDKRGNIRINIEMRVSYNKIRQRNIGEATLNIGSEGNNIACVRFYIVNSKY